MNIETHSDISPRNRKARLARTVALLACLQVPIFALPASAETIPALQGVQPMGEAELASHYGGFALPNGTTINIGYQVTTEVQTFEKQLFTRLSITTGPMPSSGNNTVPTITANIQTINGRTTIVPVAPPVNNIVNTPQVTQNIVPDVQNSSNQGLPGPLPQGIQIAGISLPLNGQTTQVSASDFSKILQGLSLPTTVLNTVNNAIITQNKTIGIDIANGPKFNAAAALGFHNLISQFGAGTRLH